MDQADQDNALHFQHVDQIGKRCVAEPKPAPLLLSHVLTLPDRFPARSGRRHRVARDGDRLAVRPQETLQVELLARDFSSRKYAWTLSLSPPQSRPKRGTRTS